MSNPVTVLYEKRGRRYYPHTATREWERDAMRVGTCRLEVCTHEGERHYAYPTPDFAAVEAALVIARAAMVRAMCAAAVAVPQSGAVPFTRRERKLIEKHRAEWAAIGGMMPEWWAKADPTAFADAAIGEVRKYMKEAA